MSSLSVYHVSSPQLPDKVLTHLEDIASTLKEHGIGFERRQALTPVRPGAAAQEVLDAYRAQLDELITAFGCQSVEVISEDGMQLSTSAVAEQVCASNDVHWMVAGRGLLSLHIGDYVYALFCERHDLVSMAAGTRHWFDAGEHPHLIAVHLSTAAPGPTGDDTAGRFPRLDDLL